MSKILDPPFRWNLASQNHIGRLAEGEKAHVYDEFFEHVLPCCAKILSFAGDCDLLFVGRSPESIFDHLSGLLFDTSWSDRISLLQFSMRYVDEKSISRESIEGIRSYMHKLDLHPDGLSARERPVAFIDLVASGETFGRLITLLYNWANEVQADWNAVKRRVRLIGITERTKTSPKTWRWQQHVSWRHLLTQSAIKNVSIPRELWLYLGNTQEKVTKSFTPRRWADPRTAKPNYDEEHLRALRLALEVFESGRTEGRREKFASLLVKETAMKHAWFRQLAQEVRS